jgi:hypothetical protein
VVENISNQFKFIIILAGEKFNSPGGASAEDINTDYRRWFEHCILSANKLTYTTLT